jgi:mannitol/fructose-specific phosphotransferase system IIA component (Ntr-type)
MLATFTNVELIMPDLRGNDVASVLNELTQPLHAAGIVTDSLAFYHAALNREFLAPTHVSSIVAFPHARSTSVSRLSFSLGRSVRSVKWDAANNTVQLIFLIAIPSNNAREYLNLMSSLAGLIRRPDVRQAIMDATSAAEIFELLKQIRGRGMPIEGAVSQLGRD